ncbi:methyl-accepting chemotaxis protein [Paenibacillus harenae]|uniref:methyl-accepting chemotaxis protein n=1 Tax=Paenibacillus harenae TaxID=306543 RepID=UPI00278D1147|nr:methyl-accepting chemotaxis protein [Paenibacillus harenae]MDQ0058111.1 methyl-accepting chemotaxis protein [Paenibacillus harenae]
MARTNDHWFQMMLRTRGRSLGSKLFLLIFGLSFTLVAAVGWFSFSAAKAAIVDQMRESSEQSMTLAGEKLDMQLRYYAELSNQLIHNSSFAEHLMQLSNTSLTAEERNRRNGELQQWLDQLALSDSRIRDISLFALEDKLAPISTQRENVSIEASQLQLIGLSEGKDVWLPVRDKGYLGTSPKPLFAYSKLLGKRNVGSRDFALLIQIDAKVLDELIGSVKLSESASTLIVNETGMAIAGASDDLARAAAGFAKGEELSSGSHLFDDSNGAGQMAAFRHSEASDWTLLGIAPLGELTSAVNNIRLMTYIAIAASMIVTLLIGLWLARYIGAPLAKMQAIMKQAANGKLTGRLSLRGQDEISQAGFAYNQMMTQFSCLIEEARQTARQVLQSSSELSEVLRQTAASSEEINDASGNIAHGAANLAVEAERGGGVVLQMGALLESLLRLQAGTADTAHKAKLSSEEGSEALSALLKQTTDTEMHLLHVTNRIDSLDASAGSIQQLLKLMTDMAKQTRILSLNAGIEAARSGDAGRGFKAIAEQIRRLAEHSDASIEQVKQKMDLIQSDVATSVSAMQAASPHFKQTIEGVHAAARLFGELRGQMELLYASTTEMSGSLQSIGDTQQTVQNAMTSVMAVSQQSAAASGQVASLCASQRIAGEQLVALSGSLRKISSELEEQMTTFEV